MDVSRGFHVFRDGNAWCAVGPHFMDLMQSTAGFGSTPEAAVEEWRKAVGTQPRWRDKEVPALSKFTVHDATRNSRILGPNDVCASCLGAGYVMALKGDRTERRDCPDCDPRNSRNSEGK